MKPICIYLDSSIIIHLCDDCNHTLKELILESVELGTHLYPYSAAQITEITDDKHGERNSLRLDFLTTISKNTYFAFCDDKCEFQSKTPLSVYETINEVQIGMNSHRDFANFIEYDQQQIFRSELGLNPNDLNNLCGKDAVVEINKALVSYCYSVGADGPSSIRQLLELCMELILKQVRERDILTYKSMCDKLLAPESRMVHNYNILGLFSLFESFGYWSDDRSTYSSGSRFSDGQHIISASYFDILVSRDNRLRNRASAIYEVMGLNTCSISDVEFKNQYQKWI